MRARKPHNFDLGEAISMEDAISMMTIIFVLFVVFLVPLVSIDKARLEKKKVDHFWGDLVEWMGATGTENSADASYYREAFEIYDPYFLKATIRNESSRTVRYIESLTRDSSLVVVRHDLQSNNFSLMSMSKNGETTTYRHGKLSRIAGSSNWFSAQEDNPDYGEDERSKSLNKIYRSWRLDSLKGDK